MEVAILQPHDCLKRHHHHHRRPLISPANKSRHNPIPIPNPNSNPNPNPNKSNRRRRNSPPPPPLTSNGPSKAQKPRAKSPPVMGQVRILKRGENLSLPTPPPSPPVMPDPEVQPRSGPVLDGFYAGSAFVTSPSPSEVPLPAFFARRNCGFVKEGEAHNQEIACVLRKVLNIM